jgi:hypothetical protein
MKKLYMAAALAVGANAAYAVDVVLWDQPYDNTSPAFISQNVTSDNSVSTYLFDDVTVGGPGWLINKVTILGDEGGIASGTTGMHLRFQQNASFTNPGTIGASFDVVGNSGLSNGNITFGNVNPLGLSLAAGHWWISVWVDRNFDTAGQWNWRGRRPINPVQTGASNGLAGTSEAFAHNPQGGLLGTTNPGGIGGFVSEPPYDLVFKIEGEPVPEPGTLLAIGAGLAALAARRLRK